MFQYAVVFGVIAFVIAVFAFTGFAAHAAIIAKIALFAFAVIGAHALVILTLFVRFIRKGV